MKSKREDKRMVIAPLHPEVFTVLERAASSVGRSNPNAVSLAVEMMVGVPHSPMNFRNLKKCYNELSAAARFVRAWMELEGDESFMALSPRAKRALEWARVTSRAHLQKELADPTSILHRVRNVGPGTIAELKKWAEGQPKE